MEALEMSVTDEYQIPINLPNVEVKLMHGAKNGAFLNNFFSLRLWAHISNRLYWLTKADLQNDVKIQVLHANTDLFCKMHPKLFRKLM